MSVVKLVIVGEIEWAPPLAISQMVPCQAAQSSTMAQRRKSVGRPANIASSNLERAQRSCHDAADIDANHLIFRYSDVQVQSSRSILSYLKNDTSRSVLRRNYFCMF